MIDPKKLLAKAINESNWVVSGREVKKGWRILLYHSVGTQLSFDKRSVLTVTQSQFKAQMQMLKESSINIIPLSPPQDYSALSLSITFDDGFADNLDLAAPILVELGIPFTVFVTTDHLKEGGPLYLDKAGLKRLSRIKLCTIGSHTLTHRPLADLSSSEIRSELTDSKAILEDQTQTEVSTLAYPFGSANRAIADIARAAGYKLAVSTHVGSNEADRNHFMLKRTEICTQDGPRQFRLKVNGAWDWRAKLSKDPLDL